MYRIHFDPAGRGTIELTIAGFWDVAELDRFAAEFATAVERARRTCPHFSILSDSRDYPVQSPEVSAGFARIMATMATLERGGRTAIVVASALNRMQASRVFTSPAVHVFMDLEEGRRWLAEPHG